MNRYVVDLTKAQVKVGEAILEVREAFSYSCIPGATPDETGQTAVEDSVLSKLDAARKELATFTDLVGDKARAARGVDGW